MGTYTNLVRQTLVMALLGIVVTLLCPTEAKPWTILMTAIACAFFVIVSVMRHRQIMSLAAEIDEVLHSGRRVDFTSCSEGDVAILSNEMAKMVARLARTRDQLETERNALADALADVSHQIRTPLTAAGLMLPVIERTDETRERIREVRELEALLERVSWLVTTLLKIAKVDAGAMHFDATNVSAAKVSRDAATPLGTILDLHDVELAMDLDESATFTGDARWTTEALENIVKNCMEHTPVGGSITITATEDPISTTITVTDTGSGIAEEDLPHIFERFYRGKGDGDESSAPAGFGIGLALAQALISAQGGTLRARNNDGAGARFDISFPKMVV